MKRVTHILISICAMIAVFCTTMTEPHRVLAQTPQGVLRLVHDAPRTPPVAILVEGQTVIHQLAYDQRSDVSLGPGHYRVDVVHAGVPWDGGPAGRTPSLTHTDITIVAGQIQTVQLIEVDGAVQLNPLPVEAPAQGPIDRSGTMVWGAALLLAAGCGAGLVLLRRRNR